jgi:hypothetical protein
MEMIEAVAEAPGLTEDQAVSELLSRWQSRSGAPVEEAPSEPADDADAGNGLSVKEAADELLSRHQATKDEAERPAHEPPEVPYEQAHAEEKAQADYAKQIEQFQHQRIEGEQAWVALLTDHQNVCRRLQQLESVNPGSVDANTLARLNHEYIQLQAAKSQIEGQYAHTVQSMQADAQAAQQARTQHAEKILESAGWDHTKVSRVADYLAGIGVDPQVLRGVDSGWQARMLEAAARAHESGHKATSPRTWTADKIGAMKAFARAQGVPEAAIEHASTTPWMLQAWDAAYAGHQSQPKKTSAKPTTSSAKAADAAMRRVQESGSLDDAAAALVARAAARAGKQSTAKSAHGLVKSAMARLQKSGNLDDAVAALVAKAAVRRAAH